MAISQMKKKEEEEHQDDSKMNLVNRHRKKAFDIFKVIFKIAFSNLGMLFLNIAYAIIGKNSP
jgi:lipopolysaccharide/colanic/teichoic acid biosynthesis glycosyltransferase